MKKEEKTEITRERIMAAAMREFGEKGYSAASLNAICGAGIPKGLLYHNFKNKDALYLACVAKSFSALTAYLREKDTGSDLRGYMDARLRFFQENEYATRLFFEAILQPPEPLKKEIKDLQKDFKALNLALYQKMLSSLTLRQGVSEADALAYFSLMQDMFNGYFSSPVYSNLPFSDIVSAHEVNLSKFLDFMLYGLAERGCKA
ncbi:TetR/AcrR family transcriptional regulator [Eubacterium sp. 1001713B170207_170306_E7]|uniref:TetR/AcrR family transcriptional regulator n=1 Tax=Eubacterium sp. 1001713B170207_170306_E7 TaxID=2787097 RepID=UPI00189BA39F|nr:TetR/AcrR family transcriptional regulator [Eubacterium sp. 1001713B170207_170306_E7]